MTNFLTETNDAIKNSWHKIEDIMFIWDVDWKLRISYKEFENVANFEYDSWYGAAEIPIDLIVYFCDWQYMTRWEYDWSEWWEYQKPLSFSADDKYIWFDKIKLWMWDYLEDCI